MAFLLYNKPHYSHFILIDCHFRLVHIIPTGENGVNVLHLAEVVSEFTPVPVSMEMKMIVMVQLLKDKNVTKW